MTNNNNGGYLTAEAALGNKLIRRRDSFKVPVGSTALSFINNLQQVQYKVNSFVLALAEAAKAEGLSLGKFVPSTALSKSRRAQRKAVKTEDTLAIANEFVEAPCFYIPWSFDRRGRVYPIPAVLTPQDTDFGKALITFAEGGAVTDEAQAWLAIHLATTWGNGIDKSSLTDRIDWAYSNFEYISDVAVNALAYVRKWSALPSSSDEVPDEPWEFVSAAEEFYHCVILGDRSETSIMVAVDATCSGIQVLAGLAKDADAAALVNVIPGEVPQDAYMAVANAAKAALPEELGKYLSRKMVKPIVMTVPYNASSKTHREAIADYIKGLAREEVKAGGEWFKLTAKEISAIAQALADAMEIVLPGPMGIRKWITEGMKVVMKAAPGDVTWVTPSGFKVVQVYQKVETVEFKSNIGGRHKCTFAVGSTDEVQVNKHVTATVPNFIHSLDASILQTAYSDFASPFSVIHDSVLARAADMSDAVWAVKSAYAGIFSGDVLAKFGKAVGIESAPPVVKNSFNPEVVLDSNYFFS